ncbi:Flagellar transcriptional regulator FlhD [Pseudidiomarina piscicola]|uniref:Flagellar transcriptional regulator FlhD n=1 Tax=Pseudidiomarina piscicola TaxID=2614830 RepID=A0A6S6WNA3_9GAMM|nr:flagellar transcriptional regulator FlhD [Pseudidiomarina piscicola]CAB0151027.1 Flagellar transcriptional regulator FlhD [Pseudidiomarina piscicola]VZT40538.1 Flagellar transcriptional regulator FlhD [Pseudomonas aeruginosa]
MKSLLEEVQELNMTFLMLAQRLIADDRFAAIAKMNITDEQCNVIEKLSASDIIALSKRNQFLFSFELSGDEVERSLSTGRGSNSMTKAAHLSIALLNKEAV